jgi:hypothetical protein
MIASQDHYLPNHQVILHVGDRTRRASGYCVLLQHRLCGTDRQLAELHAQSRTASRPNGKTNRCLPSAGAGGVRRR